MESILINRLSPLAHPGRVSVFRLLMRRYPAHVPAGEIGEALAIKPSTASTYLAALTAAGLIGQMRQGTSLRYQVQLEAAQSSRVCSATAVRAAPTSAHRTLPIC